MKCATSPEQAIVFGQHQNLIGIFRSANESLPALDNDASQRLAVLMLNAGMLHSTGPFRMHVDLARALSKAGIPSLRFDVSGIGESLAIGASGSSLQRVANEVSAAMDYVQVNTGIQRFALFGLCAGADDALYAALHDKRITGLFSVDGLGYRTGKFYWHRLHSNYWPKLSSPRKWRTWWLRRLGRTPETPPSLQFGDDIREFPSREIALQQLRQLIERRVRMHYHYTGGVGSYYNYAEQFRDMFPELYMRSSHAPQCITTSFQPESDHVCFLCEHRAELVRLATAKFVEFQRAPAAGA
jgi:hypothetical protein